MNFLLIIFQRLVMCITYKITPGDYVFIRDLIVCSDEAYLNELYNEITRNSDFLCSFTLYESIKNNKKIKLLELNNKNIETGYNIFPKVFCEIADLRHLTIIGLNLCKLPNRFENLKDLKILNLSNNKFQEFPKVLFSLTTLKTLSININKITMIPSKIIEMTGLETLNINHSYNLKNIYVDLCKLENLKELDLSFNILLFANENFIDCSMYSDSHLNTNSGYCDENSSMDKHGETFSCLKNLLIHNNSLSLFPSYFQNFVNLEELDISENDFEKIPDEIYSFSKLKKLEINHNRIKIINIGNNIFNNMLKLCIRNNEILQCSISDNALQSLVSLDLSVNRIYKLDNNILKLKQLKYLIIFNNVLTEIEKYHHTRSGPSYLNLELKNISVLANIFYYNNIEKLIIRCSERFDGSIDIFENASANSKIKYLNLSNCYLANIPNTIFKLTNLTVFIANNNRIVELKNVFGT
ncbi:Leucine rich repeat protein, partial [Spraguea lophii 42_110]